MTSVSVPDMHITFTSPDSELFTSKTINFYIIFLDLSKKYKQQIVFLIFTTK